MEYLPGVTLEPLVEKLAALRGNSGRREYSPFREELTVEDRRFFDVAAAIFGAREGAATPRCTGNT